MVSYQEVEMRKEHTEEIARYIRANRRMYNCDNCLLVCDIKKVFKDKLKTVCGRFTPIKKPSISRKR